MTRALTDELIAEIRALRAAGLSRRQISEQVGYKSNHGMTRALAGTTPPEWTKRPKAKDDVRSQAIALRREGCTYSEIAARTGASAGSLSLWLRDLELTPEVADALDLRRSLVSAENGRRKALKCRTREAEIDQLATRFVGEMSWREMFVAGVVAYWCEGAKSKRWRQRTQVQFINSDPLLISMYLNWLRALGIPKEALTFRVSIHETADEQAAVTYWADTVSASPSQFRPSTIKRHAPKTVRRNVGDAYHGCLTITVRRSADFYRHIDSWFRAIAAATQEAVFNEVPDGLFLPATPGLGAPPGAGG